LQSKSKRPVQTRRRAMAGESDIKSLEMRIAAIEDKLSKLNITEEEMKTYEKVAAALGQAATPGIAAGGCINECSIARNIARIPRGIIPRTIVPRFVCECNECIFGGGGSSGGGFGGFGM